MLNYSGKNYLNRFHLRWLILMEVSVHKGYKLVQYVGPENGEPEWRLLKSIA